MPDPGRCVTGHRITHLYVPADQPALIDKALSRVSGSLIFDLEDSVAPDRRPEARQNLRATLEHPHAQHVWVRVNAGAEGRLDVDALGDCRHIDGVWFAKADDPAEIATLTAELPVTVRVGLVIESAKALFALPAKRLQRVFKELAQCHAACGRPCTGFTCGRGEIGAKKIWGSQR